MADQPTLKPTDEENAAEEHLQDGGNPRNEPRAHLDASPPQPNAPAQTKREQQQDQQPVHPEPLLEHVEEREGQKEREIKNG